jgi:hypothetical protein
MSVFVFYDAFTLYSLPHGKFVRRQFSLRRLCVQTSLVRDRNKKIMCSPEKFCVDGKHILSSGRRESGQ